MTGFFISYRRDDQPGFTGRLADALESAFGADKVFRDIEDIRPGEDFVVVLQQHLRSVDVILVMIGPDWLNASKNGVRRLDDPGDFVRMEIQAGLESGKPVIPVLLAGATMPLATDLPAALSSLARRQAVLMSDANWRGDVERFISSLRELLPEKTGKPIEPRSGWLTLAGALLVLVGVVAAWQFLPADNEKTAPATASQSAMALAGRWTAPVTYDWGDQHDEVFEFKIRGKQLYGTATYQKAPLTIEQASLEDGWLRFITRSQEMLGSDSVWKEVTHRYTGQVTPEGIRFTLESGGGYSIHPPVEFTAGRPSP